MKVQEFLKLGNYEKGQFLFKECNIYETFHIVEYGKNSRTVKEFINIKTPDGIMSIIKHMEKQSFQWRITRLDEVYISEFVTIRAEYKHKSKDLHLAVAIAAGLALGVLE